MKPVRPRASDHRNLAARCAPKLRGVIGRLNAEFPHCIHRNQTVSVAHGAEGAQSSREPIARHGKCGDADVGAHAVDHPVIRACPLTVDIELAAIVGVAGGRHDTWCELD